MIKTLYPTKDTTLYQASESANTSKDEILEVSKFVSSSFGPLAVTRPIIEFNTTPLSSSLSAQGIHTGSNSGSLKYYLKLYISEEKDVSKNYTLMAHPLRSSWGAGTGRSTHLPLSTNGCSWRYRTSEAEGVEWTDPGGYFFSGSHASQSVEQKFEDVQGDIEMDVTEMVEQWHNGRVPNEGFIIKRKTSEETGTSERGSLYYYSSDTNTIYSPRLEARYDDTSHDFTAFTSADGTIIKEHDNIDIVPRLRSQYKQDSQERIFINTETKGGARSQAGSVGTRSIRFLPQSSSYAIIDYATGEYVYNHDQAATYIARQTVNTRHEQFFDLDMNGLFPERYYCAEFKVNHYSGTKLTSTRYYKSDTIFKVVK